MVIMGTAFGRKKFFAAKSSLKEATLCLDTNLKSSTQSSAHLWP